MSCLGGVGGGLGCAKYIFYLKSESTNCIYIGSRHELGYINYIHRFIIICMFAYLHNIMLYRYGLWIVLSFRCFISTFKTLMGTILGGGGAMGIWTRPKNIWDILENCHDFFLGGGFCFFLGRTSNYKYVPDYIYYIVVQLWLVFNDILLRIL